MQFDLLLAAVESRSVWESHCCPFERMCPWLCRMISSFFSTHVSAHNTSHSDTTIRPAARSVLKSPDAAWQIRRFDPYSRNIDTVRAGGTYKSPLFARNPQAESIRTRRERCRADSDSTSGAVL